MASKNDNNIKYEIVAQNIGPIRKLEGKLSEKYRNMIFALNGTGKSFIARAFYCLDQLSQGHEIDIPATDLVSVESKPNKGRLEFKYGKSTLGKIQFDTSVGKPKYEANNCIFHVFSEEFIQKEVELTDYRLDSFQNRDIIVGSPDINYKKAIIKYKESEDEYNKLYSKLSKHLDSKKTESLNKIYNIRKNFKPYSLITVDNFLSEFKEKPTNCEDELNTAFNDLKKIADIPEDMQVPNEFSSFQLDKSILEEIKAAIKMKTSPSTTLDKVKLKIHDHKPFFKEGVALLKEKNNKQCPFCEQDISTDPAKTIINEYIKYFKSLEEGHKDGLEQLKQKLNKICEQFDNFEYSVTKQFKDYEGILDKLPRNSIESMESLDSFLSDIKDGFSKLNELLELKEFSLGTELDYEDFDLTLNLDRLNKSLEESNQKISNLRTFLKNVDDKRFEIQKEVCRLFKVNYVYNFWEKFKEITESLLIMEKNKEDVDHLEKARMKTNLREKVGDTFEYYLNYFFKGRYLFNRDDFTLKLKDRKITRSFKKTASSGEKIIIAFCYFIASIHLKVENTNEYKNLFFVIDDPVSSVSYDFVYKFCQVIKSLLISNKGDVTLIGSKNDTRPKLLLLTHSSNFFNLCRSNRIFDKNLATFSFQQTETEHKITQQKNHLSPFQEQLEEVYDVVHGKDPSVHTPNSIRSVLESVCKFCKPTKELSDFVDDVCAELNIIIEKVLYNTLSHGDFENYPPLPEEVRDACKVTLKIVKHFANGQIDLIEKLKESE